MLCLYLLIDIATTDNETSSTDYANSDCTDELGTNPFITTGTCTDSGLGIGFIGGCAEIRADVVVPGTPKSGGKKAAATSLRI